MQITSSGPVKGPRPPVLVVVVAFAILYFGYGLNFLAVQIGVETFPPFLFAGTHVTLAGLILAVYATAAGDSVILPIKGIVRAALAGLFLFVGGVGLVTLGEKLGVPSGIAAVVKASAPLWVAVFEALRPHGERPSVGMIAGLLVGAVGVVVLVSPQFEPGTAGAHPAGIVTLMASAILFAIGTLIVRHKPASDSVVPAIVWQMVIGGATLLLLGAGTGEVSKLQTTRFTAAGLEAFAFLLFVHSLGAFTALNWLLRHFPASVVTTKFYVSPAIAVVAGWIVLGESLTLNTLLSLALILGGVATLLVFAARQKQRAASAATEEEILEE